MHDEAEDPQHERVGGGAQRANVPRLALFDAVGVHGRRTIDCGKETLCTRALCNALDAINAVRAWQVKTQCPHVKGNDRDNQNEQPRADHDERDERHRDLEDHRDEPRHDVVDGLCGDVDVVGDSRECVADARLLHRLRG